MPKRFTHTLKLNQYSGSHFDIGKKLGLRVRDLQGANYIENALSVVKNSFLYRSLGMEFNLSESYIAKVFPVVESAIASIHPFLLDEIKGFSEGIGEDYRKFLVFTSNFGNDRGCSQFYLNGFLARNYDDASNAVDNEFLLLKPEGSYKSFGSSTSYVERLDGMNEKGLVVSLTFGAGYPPKKFGIGAAMFQRIILDKASNVDEALDIFAKVPYVTPNNVLIADTDGNAVLIELSAGEYQIRRPDEKGFLFCANSYRHVKMKNQQRFKNPTTSWREKKMEQTLGLLKNEQQIMDFLTSDFPSGLFEPYFSAELGTLWSVIYRPESRSIYLAIGEIGSRDEIRLNLQNSSTFNKAPTILTAKLMDIELKDRKSEFNIQ